MGVNRNTMQYLFFSIVAVGIVGLGAWLWRRKPGGTTASKEEPREAPQSLELEQVGSNEAGRALISLSEDCPSNKDIESEEASAGASDDQRDHVRDEGVLQSTTKAYDRGENSSTHRTGSLGKGMAANDAASSEEVEPVHVSPTTREKENSASGAPEREFVDGAEIVIERKEDGDKAKIGLSAMYTQEPGSQEEDLNVGTREGLQVDCWPDGENTSEAATGREDDQPVPVQLVEEMENPDVHPTAEGRRSEHVAESVGGDKKIGGGVQVEAEVPEFRGPPTNPDGYLETDVRPELRAEDADNGEVSAPTGRVAPTKGKRKKQAAVYRDRRGLPRPTGKASRNGRAAPSPPAEVRLRLMLDPVQRNVSLSVVLMRPEGFPERVQPLLEGEGTVEAFDTSRYDDLVLDWTRELLSGELRIGSKEKYQWLRAARAVHIFSENPDESGMISVSCARSYAVHAVICRAVDEEIVRSAGLATGSPPLVAHKRWHGIPDGWIVLSGYCPHHAAKDALPAQFSALDPGTEVEISLIDGLAIGGRVYAEGRPPKIGIDGLPDGGFVMIGGISAIQAADGAWEADGWDALGHHLIDVVPGPSLTYQIMADPVMNGTWQFWDAHPERFGTHSDKPWGRAGICGAAVRGAEGETVIAAPRSPILIALGERREAVALTPRGNVNASVAMMSEAPCFLISATGLRRKQGRIVWLGSRAKGGGRSSPDESWVETVRSVAARRLRLEGADLDGERVWRNVKRRARRIWKTR